MEKKYTLQPSLQQASSSDLESRSARMKEAIQSGSWVDLMQ